MKKISLLVNASAAAVLLASPILTTSCATSSENRAETKRKCVCKKGEGNCKEKHSSSYEGKEEGKCGEGSCAEGSCGEGTCGEKK